MVQQEDCLVVFESIPLIYGSEAIKCLRPPFGNAINVLGKLFCTTNHKSDSKEAFKDKKFNWSLVCGLHISNASIMGEGGDVMNALGKVIAQQLMSFSIVLIKMMLNLRALFLQHYCEGVGYFTPLISIGSVTRGGNVVNVYEKLYCF